MTKREFIISHYGDCRCDPIYKNRGRIDPDCFLCEHGSEVESIMEEYANQRIMSTLAELEAVRAERDELKRAADIEAEKDKAE